MATGRTSMLAEPEFAQAVAEAYTIGMNRREMAEEFKVSPATITAWVRDPRVTSKAAELTQERILRITRKIDTEIEERLDNIEDVETELILKMRKEILSKTMVTETKPKTSMEATNDIQGAMEEDPDFAAAVAALRGEQNGG